MKTLNTPYILAITAALFIWLCAYIYPAPASYSTEQAQALRALQNRSLHEWSPSDYQRHQLRELYDTEH